VAAGLNPADAAELRAAGVPVLQGTETGLLAFRHLFARRSHLERPANLPSTFGAAPSRESLHLLESGRPLTEAESLTVLAEFGLVPIPFMAASDEQSVVEAGTRLGFPVVLKTAAVGILHKSEVGGVVPGIRDESGLRDAWREMRERCGCDVVVQPHLDTTRGIELFLGMTNDPQFGPLVTLGLGGIWIEAIGDTVSFLAPCSTREVRERLPWLRAYGLLAGARGRAAVAIDGLSGVVERFSIAAATLAPWVAEIDVNPLLVSGDQFTMLDALVVPVSAATAATNRD
jgi:acyl-CoA synthetase (NDP forming)